MNINWYPGHMKKARESIKKNVNLVDLVYEVLDARIPYSSDNPMIDDLIGNKPKIIILNKCDLSSKYGNEEWMKYYGNKKKSAVLVNAAEGTGIDKIIKYSYKLTENKRKNLEKKGVKKRAIRAMIIGIPNVGKSTLTNYLSGKKGAKTGKKPGVTKGNQWIKIRGNLELLDTPGILWPKIEEKDVGLNLAYTGAIKDELLDIENLAYYFIERIKNDYPKDIEKRYNINVEEKRTHDIILEIAKHRGCIKKGGVVDYMKVSHLVMDDFRKGMLGRITLELPNRGN